MAKVLPDEPLDDLMDGLLEVGHVVSYGKEDGLNPRGDAAHVVVKSLAAALSRRDRSALARELRGATGDALIRALVERAESVLEKRHGDPIRRRCAAITIAALALHAIPRACSGLSLRVTQSIERVQQAVDDLENVATRWNDSATQGLEQRARMFIDAAWKAGEHRDLGAVHDYVFDEAYELGRVLAQVRRVARTRPVTLDQATIDLCHDIFCVLSPAEQPEIDVTRRRTRRVIAETLCRALGEQCLFAAFGIQRRSPDPYTQRLKSLVTKEQAALGLAALLAIDDLTSALRGSEAPRRPSGLVKAVRYQANDPTIRVSAHFIKCVVNGVWRGVGSTLERCRALEGEIVKDLIKTRAAMAPRKPRLLILPEKRKERPRGGSQRCEILLPNGSRETAWLAQAWVRAALAWKDRTGPLERRDEVALSKLRQHLSEVEFGDLSKEQIVDLQEVLHGEESL